MVAPGNSADTETVSRAGTLGNVYRPEPSVRADCETPLARTVTFGIPAPVTQLITRPLKAMVAGSKLTVTVNVQEFELPARSMAVPTTVVVPGGNSERDGGVLSMVTKYSVVLRVKLTCAPAEFVVSTVRLPGQMISGGSVSTVQ